MFKHLNFLSVATGVLVASSFLSACAPNGQTMNQEPKTKSTVTSSATQAGNTAFKGNASVTSTASPMPGNLLIADRGNSRLLVVTPAGRVVWEMNIPSSGPRGASSLGADDAFFTPDGQHIIINEEDNDMIAIIDPKTKKIVWTYGHPGHPGSYQGYLRTPDDAYMLKNGLISVADIGNQRILFINQQHKIVKQYGTTLVRAHAPLHLLAAPNGDTPLPDGGMLITEIGGSYADRVSATGKLLYSVQLKHINYPSDAQLLPNGNILVADYSPLGQVEEITPHGQVTFRYDRTWRQNALNHPSLALPLANGDFVVNDDYNDRVVVINPHTDKIVWQYGHTGVTGTANGYLNTPDGMDVVPKTSFLANLH